MTLRPCHHGMARLQIAGGGDGQQACRVTRIAEDVSCFVKDRKLLEQQMGKTKLSFMMFLFRGKLLNLFVILIPIQELNHEICLKYSLAHPGISFIKVLPITGH
jgi:hypothetical protein